MSDQKDMLSFAITIFMADGRTDGIKVVKKANWDGVGVICPRGRYFGDKSRDEFKRSGVYILIGDMNDDVDPTRPQIYVGETESLSNRLTQHNANKDFWRHVVIFTRQSISTPLNKADIKYLEFELLERAKRNKRCEVLNKQDTTSPQLSEEDEATAKGYLREMLSLLSVLNIRVFEDAPSLESLQSSGQEVIIYHCRGQNCAASGYETNDGLFVVQKESTANRKKTNETINSYAREKRDQAIKDKVMVKKGNGYIFTQNYEFKSPSAAASVIKGYNANGPEEWKDKEKVTLNERRKIEVEKLLPKIPKEN